MSVEAPQDGCETIPVEPESFDFFGLTASVSAATSQWPSEDKVFWRNLPGDVRRKGGGIAFLLDTRDVYEGDVHYAMVAATYLGSYGRTASGVARMPFPIFATQLGIEDANFEACPWAVFFKTIAEVQKKLGRKVFIGSGDEWRVVHDVGRSDDRSLAAKNLARSLLVAVPAQLKLLADLVSLEENLFDEKVIGVTQVLTGLPSQALLKELGVDWDFEKKVAVIVDKGPRSEPVAVADENSYWRVYASDKKWARKTAREIGVPLLHS